MVLLMDSRLPRSPIVRPGILDRDEPRKGLHRSPHVVGMEIDIDGANPQCALRGRAADLVVAWLAGRIAHKSYADWIGGSNGSSPEVGAKQVSVCVVAQFPWSAIRSVTETEPPGAIICSDTRITADGQKIIPWFCSKLEPIGKNLAVCYTSSNAAATILALKTVGQYSNVKRVGNSLRDAHERYGGITELIAVVSRRDQAPQLLELMPP